MIQLKQLQQSFLGHLLGSESKIAEHVQTTDDASAKQRLSIYASGYRLRLKEAITTDHGCLHGYLGDEMFDQLLDHYIDNYNSHHTSLRYYSQHITALLLEQQPFSDHPELLEIAKIEQAFNNSFDAANCTTVKLDSLTLLAPEAWPTLQIKLHESVQLIECQHNSFKIWKALSEDDVPPKLEKEASSWLIWRKHLISRYRVLTEAEANAIKGVLNGENFSDLCEGLLEYYDEEQTPVQAVTLLQTWIKELMVCDIS